ncbi:hypothetical protein ASE14_15235 [Agromyces sp. Root81]|uniref:DUF4190 domain-containing protein n=1 Tax=Agromyces sp. Root81 TaxID=1736601 RepID=UPI0006FDB6CF|nr:DUF4190 domain-containing protein [Agromyces sp. Root81]KRC59131.1 hypothetical protein ASE14_15235 [Agromyces sp. Root81]
MSSDPNAPDGTHPTSPSVRNAPVHPQQQLVIQQDLKVPPNGFATASLVFGIIGVAMVFWAWIPFLGIAAAALGFPFALTAVVTGHTGRRCARDLDGLGKRAALTGTILGWATMGVIVLSYGFWSAVSSGVFR